MSFINLEVNDTDTGLQWFIGLDRRITILRGDSGIGKSELVRIIVSPPIGVEVKSSLPCVTADDSNWNAVLTGTVRSVIILDDMNIVSSSTFAKVIKETESNNNYFLIIGREQVGEQDLNDDNLYRLSYSVKSVLKFVISEDGKKHYTEPFFDLKKHSLQDLAIRHILVEDKTNGYVFFRSLLGDCVSSAKNGKSSIVEDTVQLASENDGVLVLFDTAAFGCHMDKFYYTVLLESEHVYFDPAYECFEYLLLNTNFFADNMEVQQILSDPAKEANQYLSWQSFFEDVLEHITEKTRLKYVHGNAKFRECWFMSCDDFNNNNCNQYIQQQCIYYVKSSDKFEVLFSDTMFQKYLRLRKKLNLDRKSSVI